ncbi:MAG: zinc metalloprotease HtpX [Candidatus Spechtbacteria bacterium RIFCSPLOWO2_12_FULL_38_22]|uniref:Protease HtpX homolog n=1 Tax=Candidatus Spechtbacteria bacterium RIFCSPLOWO2_12_FULL_38_22 TaxID=1802165 RepID=A0A1G2HHI6_9BACT|nr:MAG: zinc metalloprotease HtpX [Candidatus Spechtbacteria bacterium RIFCSPHIGHO2_01_FULL_38_11]OGZ59173.1 MAG: zinc metalloprotease HtpX [Candidatus Spechtbacteria bacterium RIFCSPHIGHO2_12_FULL_38_30]OGZ61964.1 MAG: zinc metalloprotease HtpX [Candidatus Spechtbacteria bacterium RIFCSPLOWO2_12_FULL_38_22]
MASIYSHRDSNIRKTWFLITVFLLLIIGLGWVFSYIFVSQEILIFAIFISIFMSFTSYWWSDKLVLSMTRAKEIKQTDNPQLYRVVENLAITAGLPMPRVYMVNDPSPNAFATGRNSKKAVVAVTSGLLEVLDKTELEGVIAHELSHIGNRDILVSTVVVVLAGVVIYATDFLFRSLLWGGDRRRDGNGGHPALLLIGFFALIFSSLFATLLRLAVSRKREYLADASGVLLTRYPQGLASALEKLEQDKTNMRYANNATAHLFIENPFGGDKHGRRVNFLAKLFMTHPPLEDRIKKLREL